MVATCSRSQRVAAAEGTDDWKRHTGPRSDDHTEPGEQQCGTQSRDAHVRWESAGKRTTHRQVAPWRTCHERQLEEDDDDRQCDECFGGEGDRSSQ